MTRMDGGCLPGLKKKQLVDNKQNRFSQVLRDDVNTFEYTPDLGVRLKSPLQQKKNI